MATYTKIEAFPEHLAGKVHDLFGTSGSTADVCKVALCSDAPVVATDTVLADRTQVTGTGYPGTNSIANVGSRTGGTLNLVGTDVVWTAGAADWIAGRYVALYNDTPTSPADPLMGDWDYGSAFTLANGETFTVDFGATVLTLN